MDDAQSNPSYAPLPDSPMDLDDVSLVMVLSDYGDGALTAADTQRVTHWLEHYPHVLALYHQQRSLSHVVEAALSEPARLNEALTDWKTIEAQLIQERSAAEEAPFLLVPEDLMLEAAEVLPWQMPVQDESSEVCEEWPQQTLQEIWLSTYYDAAIPRKHHGLEAFEKALYREPLWNERLQQHQQLSDVLGGYTRRLEAYTQAGVPAHGIEAIDAAFTAQVMAAFRAEAHRAVDRVLSGEAQAPEFASNLSVEAIEQLSAFMDEGLSAKERLSVMQLLEQQPEAQRWLAEALRIREGHQQLSEAIQQQCPDLWPGIAAILSTEQPGRHTEGINQSLWGKVLPFKSRAVSPSARKDASVRETSHPARRKTPWLTLRNAAAAVLFLGMSVTLFLNMPGGENTQSLASMSKALPGSLEESQLAYPSAAHAGTAFNQFANQGPSGFNRVMEQSAFVDARNALAEESYYAGRSADAAIPSAETYLYQRNRMLESHENHFSSEYEVLMSTPDNPPF